MNTTNSIVSTPTQPFDASVPWLETRAEVTACRYEFARINTLTLGIAARPNQFIVSFSYYAHAKTFSDEFTSPVARGKGETFPVLYNPLNPQQNSRSESAPTSRVPVFASSEISQPSRVPKTIAGGYPLAPGQYETPRKAGVCLLSYSQTLWPVSASRATTRL